MTPQFLHKGRLLVVVIVLLSSALIGLSIGYAATASAQETQTSTPEPAAGNVGPITILEYELRSGTMTLTLDVDSHVAYSLVDALDGTQQSGVTKPAFKTGTLAPGKRTLKLDVKVIEQVGAVSLATPGDYARIQTQALETSKEPVDYQTAQTLVAGSALFGAGGVYLYVKRKRNEEDNQAERIL